MRVHPDERREQPALDELEPRQREDVEGGVPAEQGLGRPNVTPPELRHNRNASTARSADADEEREHGGERREGATTRTARTASDSARRSPAPGSARGTGASIRRTITRFTYSRPKNVRPKARPSSDLGPEHLPEDAREIDLAEPQDVDEEPRERRERTTIADEDGEDDEEPTDAGDRDGLPAIRVRPCVLVGSGLSGRPRQPITGPREPGVRFGGSTRCPRSGTRAGPHAPKVLERVVERSDRRTRDRRRRRRLLDVVVGTRRTVRPRSSAATTLSSIPPIGPTVPSSPIVRCPAIVRPPVRSPGVSRSYSAQGPHQAGGRAADRHRSGSARRTGSSGSSRRRRAVARCRRTARGRATPSRARRRPTRRT